MQIMWLNEWKMYENVFYVHTKHTFTSYGRTCTVFSLGLATVERADEMSDSKQTIRDEQQQDENAVVGSGIISIIEKPYHPVKIEGNYSKKTPTHSHYHVINPLTPIHKEKVIFH